MPYRKPDGHRRAGLKRRQAKAVSLAWRTESLEARSLLSSLAISTFQTNSTRQPDSGLNHAPGCACGCHAMADGAMVLPPIIGDITSGSQTATNAGSGNGSVNSTAFGGGVQLTGTPRPISDLPRLSSNASARVSIYLDFDGHNEARWGSWNDISTPVFSTDSDASTFNDAEVAIINEIWSRVSEKYSPFNVNVTTELPANQSRGSFLRIAIGGSSSDWLGSAAGGVAYMNSFSNSSSLYPPTGYVFPPQLANNAKYIAEAAAHEAGHTFGLFHQSQYGSDGTKLDEYYEGTGDWAPIMGNSYYASRGVWHNGTTLSSGTFQDDMSIIASSRNGFGYRNETAGTDTVNAVAISASGSTVSTSGVISRNGERDFWAFNTSGGNVSFSISTAQFGGMLKGGISIQTVSGNVLATTAFSTSGATLSASLSAGAYRLVISAGAQYGSVGQYFVTGNAAGASDGVPFSTPDLFGTYAAGSDEATVLQQGSSITFVDANGSTARGSFVSSTEIFVQEWNRTGTILADGSLQWSTGGTWSRTLLLDGNWSINGQNTSVRQDGLTLTLTNERGRSVSAALSSSTNIAVSGWGGLTGTVVGKDIVWSNGSRWTRNAGLSSVYQSGNQFTRTETQNDGTVLFVNERGRSVTGTFTAPNIVTLSGWGGLRGLVVGNNVQWGNASVWTFRSANVAPSGAAQLGGTWFTSGGTASISQNGAFLVFTNEFGGSASGVLTSGNQFSVPGWGNLNGTVSAGTVQWSNGSRWISVSSLLGNYTTGGQTTSFQWNGSQFLFINERGGSSTATITGPNQFTAVNWGGLTASFSGNQINWSNGTVWTRATSGSPAAGQTPAASTATSVQSLPESTGINPSLTGHAQHSLAAYFSSFDGSDIGAR